MEIRLLSIIHNFIGNVNIKLANKSRSGMEQHRDIANVNLDEVNLSFHNLVLVQIRFDPSFKTVLPLKIGYFL